jgi:hypothetical protein
MRNFRLILAAGLFFAGLLGAGIATAQSADRAAKPEITLPVDLSVDLPPQGIQVNPVPEPASMALFAAGAGITAYVLTRARRRR